MSIRNNSSSLLSRSIFGGEAKYSSKRMGSLSASVA